VESAPSGISWLQQSSFTFGDGLLEYMKNPTNIKRKKENIYWKRKDKLVKDVFNKKRGGFG